MPGGHTCSSAGRDLVAPSDCLFFIVHTIECAFIDLWLPSFPSPLRYSGTHPTSTHTPTSTTPAMVLGERPTTPKRRPSLSNSKSPSSTIRGKGRGRKDSDVGIGLGSVDKVLHEVDGLDNAVSSPMSMDGDPNGSLSMDGVLGGLEMFPLKPGTIDVFSDSEVKIEEGGLDQIFASDEEDEGQEVCVCVCVCVCLGR